MAFSNLTKLRNPHALLRNPHKIRILPLIWYHNNKYPALAKMFWWQKEKKRKIKFCHWFRPSAEKLDPGELITEKPRKSSGAANYRQSLTALIVNRRRFIITLLITARQRANKTRNRSFQKSGWALFKGWFCIQDWNALRQFITHWWTFI